MILDRKIDAAIKLLQSIPTDEGPIEVCYSGGKDSDVILELAKMAGINYRAIYKNTTIDPRGTMQHVREMGVEVVQPKENFLNIVRRKGMPSRFSRFCCEILKEYPILPRAVLGIRRDESRKRAERYKEPELCRVYSGGTKVRQYLPILEWTNDDVKEFIEQRKIKCAPVYYDENGEFDVNRRLGCVGCPLANKKARRAGYLENPKMLLAQVKALQDCYDKKVSAGVASATMETCNRNAWVFFYATLFYDSIAEFKDKCTNLLFDFDIEAYMKDYFKIKL
jgi:phosphoadenosine phosphosulfate reductase